MKIDSDFRGIIFIGSRIATSYTHNHRYKKSPEKKSSDEINKKREENAWNQVEWFKIRVFCVMILDSLLCYRIEVAVGASYAIVLYALVLHLNQNRIFSCAPFCGIFRC